MRASLVDLLARPQALLADGATGTNFMEMGLEPGYPPDLFNIEAPDKPERLYRNFVDAGSDIILTNTFGANAPRLKLHNAQDQTYEINKAGAEIACVVADSVEKPVVVAGSVGPTGELFAPLGSMTEDEARAEFEIQMRGLKDGGADVAWIETMSAPEEIRAAAQAAVNVGLPYVFTASFDTAGKTMMGLAPKEMGALAATLPDSPVAFGANCGVGASDLLVSVLAMTNAAPEAVVVAKANCGIPVVKGASTVYTGTPDLMARYVHAAIDSGARIIGGCCGTSPDHLRAMRAAIDSHSTSKRPSMEEIIADIGPLTSAAPDAERREPSRARNRRRRA